MISLTLAQFVEIVSGTLSGVDGQSAGTSEIVPSQNSIDSRTLRQGDLFWALPGEQTDGHHYVAAAFRARAVAAVVETPQQWISGPQVVVENSLRALQIYALWHRQQQEALLIGVTGSVGKTSTRQLLADVLSQTYDCMQSLKNYNNHLGVPLSLLQLQPEHEVGVIELAASAPGEIKKLANWVQPEIGVLTPIGPAHLKSFGDLSAVIHTKAELLTAIPRSGFVVLPEQVAALPEIYRVLKCRALVVGQNSDCDLYAKSVQFADGLLQFEVDRESWTLPVTGKHFLTAALSVLAIARELGMPCTAIQAGFDQFQPLPGRCACLEIGSWTVIDDSYNASPLSMTAGLEALRDLKQVTQRMAVLGDMLDLGEQSSLYHQQLGEQAARSGIDFLLLLGPHAEDIAQGAQRGGMSGARLGVFQDLDSLQEILSLWLTPGSGILIKGSRGMRMERLLHWLKASAVHSGDHVAPTPLLLQAG